MSLSRRSFSVLPALLLAACQTTQAAKPPKPAPDHVIADVNVTVASNFFSGFPALDGTTPQQEAEEVKAHVLARLHQRLVVPNAKPGAAMSARLEVVLTQVSVASGAGRVLLQSDSHLTGYVTLVDARTGQKLVADAVVIGDDEAAHGGGNVGFILSLAINAATAGDRYQKLADNFAVHTADWAQR